MRLLLRDDLPQLRIRPYVECVSNERGRAPQGFAEAAFGEDFAAVAADVDDLDAPFARRAVQATIGSAWRAPIRTADPKLPNDLARRRVAAVQHTRPVDRVNAIAVHDGADERAVELGALPE